MTITALDPKTALIVIDLQKGVLSLPVVHPVKGVLATFRRKIAVFDPAILCSEGDGSYLAVSFGPRSTIAGAAPLTACWLAVGPGNGRC